MLKIVFAFLVGIHGVIHALGFVKAFDLATVSQLVKPVSKPIGMLWLVTTLLFSITITLFLLKKDWWWTLGIVSVLLSQVLIIIHWQDARFGTIANVVILLVCFVGYGGWKFDKTVQKELNAFLPATSGTKTLIDENSVAHLPEVVQQWFRKSAKKLNKPKTVHLIQHGRMKTAPDGNWMEVNAEQWFTTEKPGFLWNADVGKGSFLQFSGRDKYENGKGNMLIKLHSLFAVVNAEGKNIDQGSAVRYLSEIVWFPSAALSDFIHWEEVGSHSAKATLNVGETNVSGIFTFNNDGLPIRFEAERFYDKTEQLETWLINIDEDSYQSFNGRYIPTKASVTWKLKGGDFTWFEVEIKNVDYT